MSDMTNLQRETHRTFDRISPRLDARFIAHAGTPEWEAFRHRLTAHFPDLFRLLLDLYGDRYDFLYHLEEILALAAQTWLDRPADLKTLDAQREAAPDWFQSNQMLGAVYYVDLFAGTLQGLAEKIPYFKELGITYLHLMPLFRAPEGDNDGGYAVSDYRAVDPTLGTIDDLRALTALLRQNGISLVLDFIFNHTSDEHRWALAALAGDPDYAEYYFIYPDRTQPDAYERTLREIFPDKRPGSFTYRADIGQWVWTTFNSFQWDLNYHNPAAFRDMAAEMLFLANVGAEVLRLDALAFTWKELGTPCESLPKAHTLVRAFNAVVRIAAPSLLFKSEAIVHPDEVIQYISPAECQISYNPLLMALLWNSLATREVRLLRNSLARHFKIPPETGWVNYVRCHDDIGWTFDDAEAAQLGINGYDHRRFLNAFYTGRFEGSFARGLPFQENPRTGDARISGTLASLAGLESALRAGSETEVELAVRRILLLNAVILSIGGLPLLYLGDEVGTTNDYTYVGDPARAADSRWVHRPAVDWAALARRDDPHAIEGRIYRRILHLIHLRKQTAAFAGSHMDVIHLSNDHVFAYARRQETGAGAGQRVLAVNNFSERTQPIDANEIRLYGLGYRFRDLVTGREVALGDAPLVLEPYEVLWLEALG